MLACRHTKPRWHWSTSLTKIKMADTSPVSPTVQKWSLGFIFNDHLHRAILVCGVEFFFYEALRNFVIAHLILTFPCSNPSVPVPSAPPLLTCHNSSPSLFSPSASPLQLHRARSYSCQTEVLVSQADKRHWAAINSSTLIRKLSLRGPSPDINKQTQAGRNDLIIIVDLQMVVAGFHFVCSGAVLSDYAGIYLFFVFRPTLTSHRDKCEVNPVIMVKYQSTK